MPLKLLSLLGLLLLASCASRNVTIPFIPGLGPHKIDIQQGNVVTKDMVDKLQPGMTRSQVRFVLGTPLLVDPFRTDRWDYIYSLNKAGDPVEQRQLKVYFKNDRMERFEGDVVVDAQLSGKPQDKSAAKPMETPEAKLVQPAPQAAKPTAMPAAPAAEAKPVPLAPAHDPSTAANIKPALRLAPTEGEPAKPEDLVPPAATVAPAAQAPAPESLDTPPLPPIELPPEPAAAAAPAKP